MARHRTLETQLTPTLKSHFDLLYRPKRLFGKSPETTRLYHFSIGYFTAYLRHEATIDDLDDAKVMGCMEWIVAREPEGLGLSVRTANKTRDQLVALWNFLARKGAVTHGWPEVPSLPEPARTPIGWTPQQLKLLWEMCAAQRGLIGGVPTDLWWLGIHYVAYDTLERIGAVRKLQWKGVIGLDEGGTVWANFPPEVRKGRKSDNTCKLHAHTADVLRAIRDNSPDTDSVFPWPKNHTYLHTRYRELRSRAGLPTDRYHSFHCIRRTGASFAEAAGGDPSRLLRHSGPGVYAKHYRVPSLSGEAQAVDYLQRPDDPRPAA